MNNLLLDKKYRDRKRNKIIDLLGGKCVRCGFEDRRALQIDHVEGNGHEDKKKGRYISRLLESAEADDGRLQLLCANCDWIKRYENNEHPYS